MRLNRNNMISVDLEVDGLAGPWPQIAQQRPGWEMGASVFTAGPAEAAPAADDDVSHGGIRCVQVAERGLGFL
jgi:hypothetical protein